MLPKNSPPFLASIVMTGRGGPYNFTLPAIPEVCDYYGLYGVQPETLWMLSDAHCSGRAWVSSGAALRHSVPVRRDARKFRFPNRAQTRQG